MVKARFIAIEGVSGGSKKLAEGLEFELATKGVDAVVIEEPSDGKIGHRIRKILNGKLPAPKTEFGFQLLYIEDRVEQIRRTIRPNLNLGNWVISAGYWLSTLAHGMLEDSTERYLQLHRDIIGEEMLYPDLTLLLDAPVEQERLEKVRLNYLWLGLAKTNNERFGNIAVINASKSKEEILTSAIVAIKPLL